MKTLGLSFCVLLLAASVSAAATIIGTPPGPAAKKGPRRPAARAANGRAAASGRSASGGSSADGSSFHPQGAAYFTRRSASSGIGMGPVGKSPGTGGSGTTAPSAGSGSGASSGSGSGAGSGSGSSAGGGAAGPSAGTFVPTGPAYSDAGNSGTNSVQAGAIALDPNQSRNLGGQGLAYGPRDTKTSVNGGGSAAAGGGTGITPNRAPGSGN